MRKNYFLTLLFTLCLASFSFGQTTVFEESFETGNSGTTSEDCNDGAGDFFTRTDGSDIGSFYQVTGQDGNFFFAAMDTDGSPCTMATQTLFFDDIDISTYTDLTLAILLAEDKDGSNFDWDEDSRFFIEVDVDNSGTFTKVLQVTVSDSSGGSNVSQPMIDSDFDGNGDGPEITDIFTEYTASISSGSLLDVRLVFENLLAGDEDMAVDNLRIIDGFVAEPSLAITAPSNNTEFNPWTTETPITFDVQNFTLSGDNGSGMSDGSGDGYIVGTSVENGGTPENINIFNLTQTYENLQPGDQVTLTAELVDNAGNSLSPAVTAMATFTVATFTQVADIAALRAGTEGEYYELTGEAVLTFIGTSRNQKYIEDSSAAILIDDDPGVITTSYNVGDGISAIKGRLGSFGSVTQFAPQVDPGAATSMGNPIVPQVVGIAALLADIDAYESEWITINDVNFTDADGTATFSTGNNYDITDGTDTMVFRVHFSGTDIDGTVIPSSSANITGLAAQFNTTIQIMGTSLANIVLSVQRDEIAGYAAYPNPVTGNNLTITTNSIDTKRVDIFNVLGRRVFSQSFTGTSETLEISNVSSGIYILKVTEGNKVATQKLIIE